MKIFKFSVFFGLLCCFTLQLAAQPTITLTTSPFLELDSNMPGAQGPTAAYVGFKISNITGTTYQGMKATITLSGAGFSLAGGQVAAQEVGTSGTFAPGEEETLYWFIQYPTMFDQTVTFSVQLTDAMGNVGTPTTATASTRSSISANAGGLIASTTLGPGIFVGQIVHYDVNYTFGNIKAGDYVNMQPAGNPTFQAGCYQMIDAEVMLSEVSGITVGDRDQIYYTATANQNGSSIRVNMRYYFFVKCQGIGATQALPYATTLSGTQYKYSGNYGIPVNLPNPLPSISIAKSVTPSNIPTPPGFVTYTVTVTNTATVDVSFQKITDILPTPLNFEAISGTSQVNASNSSMLPLMNATGTLMFVSDDVPADMSVDADYFIPVGQNIKLIYTAEVPAGTPDGNYNNCVTATTGNYTTPQAKAAITVGCNNPCLVSGPQGVCASTTGIVYSAPTGQTTYNWSVTGSGSIVGSNSGQTINVTAGASGTYTVSVTITDNIGCITNCAETVTINPLPACNITGPNPICASSTGNIYAAPASLASYLWSISGDGSIVGATNTATVNVTAGNTGPSYTLTLTTTNANGCSSTCTYVVNFSGSAAVMANVLPASLSFCLTNVTPMPLNGNPSGGTPPFQTHIWSGNGTVFLNNTNTQMPTLVFDPAQLASTYTLIYTVTDNAGCSASDVLTIDVYDPPTTITSAVHSGCNSATQTYDLSVNVIYQNQPPGNITLTTSNGATTTVPQTGSPQTIVMSGIAADGLNDIDVTAFFVADPSCYFLLPNAYDAPQPCPCDVAALPFTTQNGMVCAGTSIDLSTLVSNTIGGGVFTYYATLANAQNGTSALVTSIVSPLGATNYYVRKTLGPNCFLVMEMTITIKADTCGVITITGPN